MDGVLLQIIHMRTLLEVVLVNPDNYLLSLCYGGTTVSDGLKGEKGNVEYCIPFVSLKSSRFHDPAVFTDGVLYNLMRMGTIGWHHENSCRNQSTQASNWPLP